MVMRIVKKLIYSLSLVLPLLCFCSCHGSKSLPEFFIPDEFDSSKEYNISFWAKNDTNQVQQNVYSDAVKEFEKIYPNIHVSIVQYNDYTKIYSDVITNIATKTTPNIAICYPDHVATYMEGKNVVVPLDSLISSEKYGMSGSEVKFDSTSKDMYYSKFLDECIINDSYYMLPFMRSSEAMYVNKSYLIENGFSIPKVFTWDYVWEICEYAEKKSNAQNTIMVPLIYKSTDNMFIQLCKQNNYEYTTDNGDVLFMSDDVNNMLVNLGEKSQNGYFDTFKRISYPGNFFNKGQCIFAIDSTAGSTWLGSDAPLLDIDSSTVVQFETLVTTIPQVDVDNPKMISQGPSICLFNKENNQEVLASWLFMQYLLTNKVQIDYSKTEGYVPVTKKATESKEYIDYLNDENEYSVKIDATKLVLNNIDNTFITPVFNGSANARSASGYLIEALFSGYTTKEQIDTLFNNVDSRYKLSTFVKGEIVKPDVKGVNQYLGYCLLGVIGIVWIGIGIYFLKNYVLRKR